MSTALPVDTNPMSTTMNTAVILSLLFHSAFVVIGIVGLPYIKKPILPPEPISVEIVEIDEITQTNKRAAAPKEIEKPIEKPVEVKEDKPPAPPKVDLQAPPQVIEPKPEEIKEEVKPKVKPTPPPPKEAELKEPEPKLEEVVEETAAQQEEFLSLLKNLQDGAPEQALDTAEVAEQAQISPLAQFSNRVTQSEMDAMKAALNRQFQGCWNLSAGAKFAEDIVVKIRLFINPDRTIRDVRIVDQWRYTQDNFFRAAADNVMRAVRHPACQVLDLPSDKYEFWKDSVFNFNPSQML